MDPDLKDWWSVVEASISGMKKCRIVNWGILFAAVVDAVAVGDVIDVTVDAVALSLFVFVFCDCCSVFYVVACARNNKNLKLKIS